jgi:hypothetical protein
MASRHSSSAKSQPLSFMILITTDFILGILLIGSADGFVPRSSAYASGVGLPAVQERRCFRLLLAASDSDENASVGDYVKGVHGGKYQFEDASAISFEGQQFTESLYSSGPMEEDEPDEEEPMPKWAERLGNSVTDDMCSDTIRLSPNRDPVQVKITNQERTWEPFYAKVVGDDMITSRIKVSPLHGKLAPLNGADNPYDPQNPYSDSTIINVSCSQAIHTAQEECYLAVGTEEEKWYYKLIIE